MKNTINTQDVKAKAQSASVATIKALVCVPHIALVTAADLLSFGEAKLINVIDGTPVTDTMNDRTSYTAQKMAMVAMKAIEINQKIEDRRNDRKEKDIAKLKEALDKLEGVEHIETKAEPVVEQPKPIVPTPPTPPVQQADHKPMTAPAPPKKAKAKAATTK